MELKYHTTAGFSGKTVVLLLLKQTTATFDKLIKIPTVTTEIIPTGKTKRKPASCTV